MNRSEWPSERSSVGDRAPTSHGDDWRSWIKVEVQPAVEALTIGPSSDFGREQPPDELALARSADRCRRRAPAAIADRAGLRPGWRASTRGSRGARCSTGAGRDRPRLHNPEPVAVVAPLDILRRAVVPLDAHSSAASADSCAADSVGSAVRRRTARDDSVAAALARRGIRRDRSARSPALRRARARH